MVVDLRTASRSAAVTSERDNVLAGALLGCALGDALGLPAEGLNPAAIARRFVPFERFRLVGRTGFVSDDTEQTALVAEAIAIARIDGVVDVAHAVRHFRRRLLGWFLRLPFGVGLATVRACFKILMGFKNSGVRSAGNGAAMRSAIIGVALRDDEAARRSLARAVAAVTHVDARAVDGALVIAELAALLAGRADADRAVVARAALAVVTEPTLMAALEAAVAAAISDVPDLEAARSIGTSGFVMHTVPLAVFMIVRHGADPMTAIRATIAVGGDTDTNAAIVGAVVGGQHGAAALPAALLDHIQDGPFGPSHLRALATALATSTKPPRWSGARALLRNLALYPVVLAHGFRRLVPWG